MTTNTKKHDCPDCKACQWCADRRCELCRGWLVKSSKNIYKKQETNYMNNMSQNKSLPVNFKVNDNIQGFIVKKITEVSRLGITVLEFLHVKSGGKLLHLACSDKENLFAVAFRTPPPDDTGLPHILEHTVLCGSKRFPVKDPFVELLKTSLATFLNAFTYPDRTIYPCSSLNKQDFRNLMRVYCDAVFSPLLLEDHFRQEGHHLELKDPKDLKSPFIIKGIVYNEMRGVYSDLDNLLSRYLSQYLFQGNAYGRDFGGDPDAIPSLTYQQFLDFHKYYYHPSNAWFFTYGDADIIETLTILNAEYLQNYNKIDTNTTIKTLEPWSKPKKEVLNYPIDKDETTDGKYAYAIAYATNSVCDTMTSLALYVIDSYLLDNSASPLRKALIDSKLGEELGSSGYASWQRDTYFSVVLKGMKKENTGKVFDVINKCLQGEINQGFSKDKVKAALQNFEFASREIKSQYPLVLMERVYGGWLYDIDPLVEIDIADSLDKLTSLIENTPNYLESLAKKYFLDNKHYIEIVMQPDREYMVKSDQELSEKLSQIKSKMSDNEVAEVAGVASRLEVMQSEPNSQEAIATLPRLKKQDIEKKSAVLPTSCELVNNQKLLITDVYSGGVDYLCLSFDITALDNELIDFLPLFCEASNKMGSKNFSYLEMAEKEAAYTGGVSLSVGTQSHISGIDNAKLMFYATLKSLEKNIEKALDILHERIFSIDFSDKKRLQEIILQSRMSWKSQIVPAGNQYASLYAAKDMSPIASVSERIGGCTQGRLVDKLADNFEKSCNNLIEKFIKIQQWFLTNSTVSASFVGNDSSYKLTKSWYHNITNKFKGELGSLPSVEVKTTSKRIGLAVPAEIAFVSTVLKAPSLLEEDAAALILLSGQLSYGYLWNEIRVKGGAYGSRAAYDGSKGLFSLASYRDPNISKTLNIYQNIPNYIQKDMDLTIAGLEQAIIGTTKSLDQPIRPSVTAMTALARDLAGDNNDFRDKLRDKILSLSKDDIFRANEKWLKNKFELAEICVLTSREKLEQENLLLNNSKFKIETLW